MSTNLRILIVVVLYRASIESSKTLHGLAQAFTADPALSGSFDAVVWDNSPTPQPVTGLPPSFRYRHAERNTGVAGAYNAASGMARESGAGWLLLFDHDTEATGAFLAGMLRHAQAVQHDRRIAAVTPVLLQGDFILSPRRWRLGGHRPARTDGPSYTERRRMFAANSGVLVRVAALDAIGGYSERFWLDYSDIYVFERFHQAGFLVWIATDLRLQHEVAMLDYDARMTPTRYGNYLAAESAFLDLYRGTAEHLLHFLRLAVRAVRQRRFADASYARLTRGELWRRVRVRRSKRVLSEM